MEASPFNKFLFWFDEKALAMMRPNYTRGRKFGYLKGNINYLHQLQNLYYALTDKELEINL